MSTLPLDSILMRTYQGWLQRYAPDLPTSLQEAIGTLFQAVEAGHVCIRVPMDVAAAWQGHQWVGRPGSYAPFVLEDSGRFYLSRYWHHEECVARDLHARAQQTVKPERSELLRTELAA